MSRLLIPMLVLTGCAVEGETLPADLAPSLPLGLDLLAPAVASRGDVIDLEVTGAAPGDTVVMVAGGPVTPDASCPPALPDCLDVPRARLLATSTAGPGGDATFTVSIPPGDTYAEAGLQAVAWPQGQQALAVASAATPLQLLPTGCVTTVTLEVTTVNWAAEMGFAIGTSRSSIAVQEPPNSFTTNGVTFSWTFPLVEGGHVFVAEDSFGDGWHDGTATITDSSGVVLMSFQPGNQSFDTEVVAFDVPCVP